MLFLHDLTRRGQADYEAAEAQIAARLPAGARLLHVYNKCDLVAGNVPADGIVLSARTGAGLQALRQALLQHVPAGMRRPKACSSPARAMCRRCSARARTCDRAAALADEPTAALDLLAEELRLAHDALGEITGAFTADDLLGEIFSRFCIGK